MGKVWEDEMEEFFKEGDHKRKVHQVRHSKEKYNDRNSVEESLMKLQDFQSILSQTQDEITYFKTCMQFMDT